MLIETRFQKVDKKLKASFQRIYNDGTDYVKKDIMKRRLTSHEEKARQGAFHRRASSPPGPQIRTLPDGDVGRHDAEPGVQPRAHQPHRQAVLEHEQIERPEAEHDDRVARQAVETAAPRRQALVLAQGQRVTSPVPRRPRWPEVAWCTAWVRRQ